ncbi:M20/M25/M40 family metallo-hydrolase [Geothrix sp. 21YS21S-4]|uniref:M20/M25/M40 family metallo-hydrolase n=1 Tax=Geothrix sp. 21YS21S-4 TaxID=3068889 RepID=UPI0027B922EF|nr:M20/M25/M40 family metallo-hydrolase [Geothrix sp. 21YS21S-4]
MTPADLLTRLVGTPSVSGEEGPIADFVQNLAASRGFDVHRQGHNLWFSFGSKGGARLLLNSHLDTVPPCAGWGSDPFTPVWHGTRLQGLGANDAKGCAAAILLAAFDLAGQDLPGEVVVALTAEEETGGQGIATILDQLGPLDAAVVGEPTGLRICAAQRGMLLLKCTARGQSGHVANAQMLGAENAIHKAARDIARVAAMDFAPHPLLGAQKAQVTQISGGLRRNQVPDACEFFVDLRTGPDQDHDALAADFRGLLESEVVVHSGRYLPKGTDPAHPIVRAALQAAGKAGPVGSGTTSDWAFLGDLPAVKAGPGDTFRSHRPDEYLTLPELDAGAAFYAALVPAFFKLRAAAEAR